jgi:predicted DNA-binding transcriptional regulator AlpA
MGRCKRSIYVCHGAERKRMTTKLPTTLPSDLLWGADEIAEHVSSDRRKLTRSQIYYLIRKGMIPVKKLGPRTICARKSEIDKALAQIGTADTRSH